MSNIFHEELIQRAEDMLYGQEDVIIGLASDLDVISDEEWEEYIELPVSDTRDWHVIFACFVLAAEGKI